MKIFTIGYEAATLGEFLAALQKAGVESTDLDAFVTARTLDGIFYMLAAEEARIRRNPRARSTDLMRQVFETLD